MMKKRWKTAGTLSLTLTLLLLAAAPREARGAASVETDARCTVEFNMTNLPGGEDSPELSGLQGPELPPIEVALYRIAEVSSDGRYTLADAYRDREGAKELEDGLPSVNAGTGPSDWERMSAAAAALAGVNPEENIFPPAPVNGEITGGSGRIGEIPTGLYLVAARQVQSEEYTYRFTPWLLSLPDNRYSVSGDDAWIYELTGSHAVSLKAAWEPRYGALIVEKTLDTFNATLGDASFVFRIEARKGDGPLLYSDVVSLRFDGPGSRETLPIAEKIPAGSTVTVTEVYAGAGYEPVSQRQQVIGALPAEVPVRASFVNRYDGGSLRGGSSVVNHFPYEEPGTGNERAGEEQNSGQEKRPGGIWDWKQQTDSSAEGV